MSHAIYFSSCFASLDVLKKYQKVILDILNGNLISGIRFKKLTSDVYSARVSQSARLLFTIKQVRGKNVLVFLEAYESHNDYDKSVFLRSRRTVAKKTDEFIKGNDDFVEITHKELQQLMEDKGVDFASNNISDKSSDTDWVNLSYYKQQFIQLTDGQQDVLTQPFPVAVTGRPGSGKTVVAQELIRDHANEHKNILYLATNDHLVSQIKRTCLEGHTSHCSNVEFTSLKELFTRLMLQVDLVDDAKEEPAKPAIEVGHDFCLHWSSQHYKENKQRYPNLSPILSRNDQIKQVYQQFRIISGYDAKSYADVGIKHTEFSKEQRTELVSLYTTYLDYLSDNNQFDVNFIDGDKLISEPAYDMVVVDEAQDFSLGMLKFVFEKLVKNHQAVFLLDPQQRLHGTESRYHYLTSHLGINKLELRQGLRCPEKVMEFANSVLALGNDIDSIRKNKVEAEVGYSVVDKEGGVYWLADDESNYQQQIENLRQLAQTPMFAIVTSREHIVEAKQQFATELVFTAEEIKGLEYFQILLYKPITSTAFKEMNNTLSHHDKSKRLCSDNEIEGAIKAFFVACTRAMDTLWVIEKKTNQNNLLYDVLQQTVMKLASTKVEQPKKCRLLAETTAEQWMDEVHKLIENGNDAKAFNVYRQQKLGSKQQFGELLVQLRAHSELEPSKQYNSELKSEFSGDCSSKQSETKSQKKRKKKKGKQVAKKKTDNQQPGSFIPSHSNLGQTNPASDEVSPKLNSGSEWQLLSQGAKKTSATAGEKVTHKADALSDINIEAVFLSENTTRNFLQRFTKGSTPVSFQDWLCIERKLNGKQPIEEIVGNTNILFNLITVLAEIQKGMGSKQSPLLNRKIFLKKFKFPLGLEGSFLSILLNCFMANYINVEAKFMFVNFLSQYCHLTLEDILKESTAKNLQFILELHSGYLLLNEKMEKSKKNNFLSSDEIDKVVCVLKELTISQKYRIIPFVNNLFSKHHTITYLRVKLEEFLPKGAECNLKNIINFAPEKLQWLLVIPFKKTKLLNGFIEKINELTFEESHKLLSQCLEYSKAGFCNIKELYDIGDAFKQKFGQQLYSHVFLGDGHYSDFKLPLFLSWPLTIYPVADRDPSFNIVFFVDGLCDDLKGIINIKALFRTYDFNIKHNLSETGLSFSDCSFFSLLFTKKPQLVNEIQTSLKKAKGCFYLGGDINCLTRVPRINSKRLTAPIIHLTLDEKSRNILHRLIDDNKDDLENLCVDRFYLVSFEVSEKACFGLSAFSGLCKTAQGRSILKDLYIQHPDLVNGLTEDALMRKIGGNLAPFEYLIVNHVEDELIRDTNSKDKEVCQWIVEHIMKNNKLVRPALEKLLQGESSYLKQSNATDTDPGKMQSTTNVSSSGNQSRFFGNETRVSSSSLVVVKVLQNELLI